MGLFDKFKSKGKQEIIPVILHLNARLQPIHRGELFEDMFDKVLSENDMGEVVGGGTLQIPTGEISSCDIEFNVKEDKVEKFISFLHQIYIIPKGSNLKIKDKQIDVGCAEGLALYLNGTDLSAEVYQKCDVNELIEQLDNALDGIGIRLSYWEGNSETALYYYGKDYLAMKEKITLITKSHLLCEKCRIKQIA